MRIKLLANVGVLIGLIGQWPATAAIFGRDDREYVSTEPGSPFAAIGLVTRGLLIDHRTTGTLVDECHVLTSQHLFGIRSSALGKRARFTGSLNTSNPTSSGGTVIAEGGLENYPSARQVVEARAHDWLLIRLDKCLGTTLGYARLGLALNDSDPRPQMSSAGYPIDRQPQKGLSLDRRCHVRGAYPLLWYTDCATLQGDSGGPIFRLAAINGQKMLEVYAIKSAGYLWKTAVPFAPLYANQATPVAQIAPQIAPYLSSSSMASRAVMIDRSVPDDGLK